MDYISGNFEKRNDNYFLVMARIQADALINLATRISFLALKDAFIRARFIDEINVFTRSQLNAIQNARTDAECRIYTNNLIQEKCFLETQSAHLQSGAAKVYASVVVTRHDKDTWSYVIDGVSVVLSGLQVAGAVGLLATSAATGNVIGVVAGGLLFLHGVNGLYEGVTNLYTGREESCGPLKKAYSHIAHFMGYRPVSGIIAYSIMDLALSGYGLGRLVLKPDAWRLFHYLRSDFIKNYKAMTKTGLLIEAYNDSWAIKTLKDNHG